jgi:hypothetical protein
MRSLRREADLINGTVTNEATAHMVIPWIPLFLGFTLLGVTLFACHTVNARYGRLICNGAMFFFAFCFIAMALDFVLTMVFASASFHDRTQYESVASRSAWSGRILSYLIPCVVSLLLALRFRARQRFAKAGGAGQAGSAVQTDASLDIQTSPYTRSKLPL